MRDHKKLRAFELADECAVMIYEITKAFPREELYGLVGQMRRAVVSAASNMVEGCSRNSRTEYLRFLEIAFGLKVICAMFKNKYSTYYYK